MSWVSIGAAAVTTIGGIAASNSAAGAQQNAAKGASEQSMAMYNRTRRDLHPYNQVGTNALQRLNADSRGKTNPFHTSEAYNFVRREGTRNIGNSFAAKGGAFGGNALRALAQYNTGLASQEHGNWWNQQMGLANLGENAAAQSGAFGQNTANQIGNNMLGAGDARASGIIGSANALSGGIANGVNAWLNRRSGVQPVGGGGGA